jgi:flavin-dependent dehydrogenase
MDAFDAVVIGGGPAGAVCASRLAAHGRSVILFERGRHPRFHLGESLLPASMGVLDAMGVLDEMRERFLVKRGARFVRGAGGPSAHAVRYAFSEAFRARWEHAFEVPRDEFDELLFRRAATFGVDAREGWTATRVVLEEDCAVGVEVRAEDGTPHSVLARVVVDASGRDAILGRAARSVQRIPHLDRTALFTQIRGGWRDTGDREGDIQIVVFGEGPERGWFWLIPFRDGRTSAGAVVSSAWVRARQGLGGPEQLFDAAVAETPAMARMLESSERIFAPRATADFSFRTGDMCGNGWVAIGDAAGFIDPLFSTGAHLAMHGGLRAADAIDEALASDGVTAHRLEAWQREMRVGADLFIGAVQAFYTGDLAEYLFAEPQHPFLRRAITSMLSGDVFDEDALWAREMRARYPAQL